MALRVTKRRVADLFMKKADSCEGSRCLTGFFLSERQTTNM